MGWIKIRHIFTASHEGKFCNMWAAHCESTGLHRSIMNIAGLIRSKIIAVILAYLRFVQHVSPACMGMFQCVLFATCMVVAFMICRLTRLNAKLRWLSLA